MLDVYLTFPKYGIFEMGQRISPKEFRKQQSPVIPPIQPLDDEKGLVVFHTQITHNLVPMAEAAGIFYEIWRPQNYGISMAQQLIIPLWSGLNRLRASSNLFKPYSHPRFGDYNEMINFVEEYLDACMVWQYAHVEAYA